MATSDSQVKWEAGSRRGLTPLSTSRFFSLVDPSLASGFTEAQRRAVEDGIFRALDEDPRILDEIYMNRRCGNRLERGLPKRVAVRYGFLFRRLLWSGILVGDRRRENRWADRLFGGSVLVTFLAGSALLSYLFKRYVLGLDIIPGWHLY